MWRGDPCPDQGITGATHRPRRESDLSIQRTGLRRWTRTGIEKESHHLHLPAASFVLALPQSLLDRSRVSQRRAQHPLLRRAGSRHRHSQTPRMDGGDRCTPGSAGLAEARARTTRALGGRGLVHAGDGASPVSVRNASARRLRGLRAGRSALPAGGAAECRRCRWPCTFRWLPSGSRFRHGAVRRVVRAPTRAARSPSSTAQSCRPEPFLGRAGSIHA